jgi:hypothetical protein
MELERGIIHEPQDKAHTRKMKVISLGTTFWELVQEIPTMFSRVKLEMPEIEAAIL